MKGWMTVETSRLQEAPWNYKRESPHIAEALAANIKRNGQIETILIRELPPPTKWEAGVNAWETVYEVVNGNHRLEAFRAAGIEQVRAYNLGKISEEAAKRIAVEVNETKFDADQNKLSGLMIEIAEAFGRDEIQGTMPFDENEMALLFSEDGPDPESDREKMPGEEDWQEIGAVFRSMGITKIPPDLADRVRIVIAGIEAENDFAEENKFMVLDQIVAWYYQEKDGREGK